MRKFLAVFAVALAFGHAAFAAQLVGLSSCTMSNTNGASVDCTPASLVAGNDFSIGQAFFDFNGGPGGDQFILTALSTSYSGFFASDGVTTFVLTGLQFSDGSVLTDFIRLSSYFPMSRVFGPTSLTVVSVDGPWTGPDFLSGQYITSSTGVPEPGTLALLGLGLAGLAATRKRK